MPSQDISLRIALDSAALDQANKKFTEAINLTEQWNGVLLESSAALAKTGKSISLRGFGEGQIDTGALRTKQVAQEQALLRQREADANLLKEQRQSEIADVSKAKATELRIQAEINSLEAQQQALRAKGDADRLAALQAELNLRLRNMRESAVKAPQTKETQNVMAQAEVGMAALAARKAEADQALRAAETTARTRKQEFEQAKLTEKSTEVEVKASALRLKQAQDAVVVAREAVNTANQQLAAEQRITAAVVARRKDMEWFSDNPTSELVAEEAAVRQRMLLSTDKQTQADLEAYANLLRSVRVEREATELKERQARAAQQIAQTPAQPRQGATGAGAAAQPVGLIPLMPGQGADTEIESFDASVIQLNKDLAKTADVTLPKVNKATTTAKQNWRDFVIELRSAGAVAAGTSWQGFLYYLSQVGRNLSGTALAAGATAFAVAALVGELAKLFVEGTRIQTLSDAFTNLSDSVGTSGDAILVKMHEVSRGTLTMADSMKFANTAFLAGGEAFGEKLPELLEIARASALATGQDISYTFQSLITGIARGSPRLIDNANIFLKLGDANAEYAQQLGKSVTEMSASEKQQATLNAVLEQGAEFTQKVGLEAETASEKLVSLGVAFANLRAAAATRVAQGGIPDFLNNLAEALNDVNISQLQATALRRELAELDKVLGNRSLEVGRGTPQVDERANRVLQAQIDLRAELERQAQSALRQRTREMAAATTFEQQAAAEANFLERIRVVRQELSTLDAQVQLQSGRSLADVWRERYGDIAPLLEADGAAAQELSARLKELAEATSAYNEALSQNSQTEAARRGQELAQSVSRLRDLMVDFPAMPDLGANVLTTNLAAVRQWAEAAQTQINPQLVALKDQPIEIANRLEVANRKLLAQAQSFATAGERMDFFTRMAFGVSGSIDDVIGSFASLDTQWQEFLLRNGLVERAIGKLREERNQAVGPKVVLEGVDKAVQQLDELASSMDKLGARDSAAALRGPAVDQLLSDLTQNWQSIVALDQAGFDNWIKTRMAGYDELARQEEAKRQQLQAMQDQLATMQTAPAPAPVLSDNLLELDTEALRTYLFELAKTDPTMREMANATLVTVNALEQQRQQILATAAAASNGGAALDRLAQQFYGAGASVLTLVENFANLSPATQKIIGQMGLLGAAIAAMRAQAAAPISLGVQITGIQETRAAIENSALRLAEVWNADDVIAFSRKASDAATADLAKLEKTHTNMSAQEYAVRRKQIEDYYTGLTDTTLNYYNTADNRAKQSAKVAKQNAQEVRSAIESALTKGLPVTDVDMLNTKAGLYRDKALENARRLNAIAERGFEELKKHADWADILKIPPEVLSGSEAALKAWAAQTSEDVQGFMRPDLINWDEFINNYKKGIDDAAAKTLTMDIALSKLKEAGLLEPGKEDEARKRVEKMFGTPSVTFDTFFEDSTPSGGDNVGWDAAKAFLKDGKRPELVFDVKFETQAPQERRAEEASDKVTLVPGTERRPTATVPLAIQPPTDEEIAVAIANAQAILGLNPAQVATALAQPEATRLHDYRVLMNETLAEAPLSAATQLVQPTSEILDAYRLTLEDYWLTNPINVATQLTVPEPTTNQPPTVTGTEPEVTPQARTLPADFAADIARDVDMTQPGLEMASKLSTSFLLAATAQAPGTAVATAWGASFTAATPLFQAMGTFAGSATTNAFIEAMEERTGNLLDRFANLVAPEVAKRLDKKRKGGEPLE